MMSKMQNTKIKEIVLKLIKFSEIGLAVLVVIGVIFYILFSINFFITTNQSQSDFFYELISRALLVTIGLELARMLVAHSFLSILELIAFVVARKLLKPDINSVDVVLGTISFIAILAANKFLISGILKSKDDCLKS